MRVGLASGAAAILLLVALLVAYGSFFTVYQTRQALVVRLGEPRRVITDPGLNVKIPIIESVIYIDKRILNIETPAQEVIASSGPRANAGLAQAGERLVVDAFARYRIVDPSNSIRRSGRMAPARSLRSCSTRRCGACWARQRCPTPCATSVRS